MSQIRSKNTALEQFFFDMLLHEGIPFEPHPKLYGKPDCIIDGKILVFVDSDFWHGWRYSTWQSRLPKEYWREKILRNIRRDKHKFNKLRLGGFKVIRIWEHSLKKDPAKVMLRLKNLLQ